MPPVYRLLILGPENEFVSLKNLGTVMREEAFGYARLQGHIRIVELWQDKVRLQRFEPEPAKQMGWMAPAPTDGI
jgi:hypothetical protein